jgi:hypothetical protein
MWYRNNGAGAFSDAVFVTTTAFTRQVANSMSVVAADLDGDSHVDILFHLHGQQAADPSLIAWYRNTGDGNFSFPHRLIDDATTSVSGILAADVDDDGDLDVISYSGINGIRWRVNNGVGRPQLIDTEKAVTVAVADIDGDGDADLISGHLPSDTIVAFRNNGANGFSAGVIMGFGGGSTDIRTVAVADLDNDADVDVIGASRYDGIVWYSNDGTGSYTNETIILASVQGDGSVSVVDLNNDGFMDVLSVNEFDSTIAWYPNAGNGMFLKRIVVTSMPECQSSGSSCSPRVALTTDVNNDGRMDVIATKQENAIKWYDLQPVM